MKTRTTIALLALAALAGCGDHHLVLKVDVLSYMDPAETTKSLDLTGLPPSPQDLDTVLTVVPDRSVNLIEGLHDVADVQSVSVTAGAVTETTAGSGSNTLRIYMSDVDTPPRSTAPVLTHTVPLGPGVHDVMQVSFDGDPRVSALFTQRSFRIEITTTIHLPAGGALPQGSVRVSQLDAVVVAKRKP